MQSLLLFVELVIAIALVIIILLQKSEGGALGIGGGGGGSMGGLFTPRGAGDALTRATSILGALFFLVCIALNLVVLNGRNETSILDMKPAATTPATQPKPATPAAPVLPAGPSVPKPQ